MQTGLRRRLHNSRRDEKGASLVEFVLILPIFALLLFGIIDFGLVFGGFISVQNEVNAAAREVSLGALPPQCQTPPNGETPALCTILQYINTSPLGVKPGQVKVALSYPTGPTVGAPLIVCAQAQLNSTTGLTSPFLNGRSFYTRSEIRVEQSQATYNPLPGGPSYTVSNSNGFVCT